MAQIISDELGQSFQLRDDESLTCRDKECLFANISTVESIASFISTSLGPSGMDKILVDQDDNITVTNDGATILKEMGMSNPISQLVQQLSQSQDEEIGDGTTTVVLLAASMLKQAKLLVERGMHPIKITEGFGSALEHSIEHLKSISIKVTDMRGTMLKAAKTSLESKIVAFSNLSEICVDGIMEVADMERNDVDLERIYIQTECGKSINETKLIKGIVIKKEVSHPQMKKEMKNARIALLSCPFEPPKLKNKNTLLIKTVDEYKTLGIYEKETFNRMIQEIKRVKADVVLCQWGFDDEANSMLMQEGIMAVRWVGGHELGLIAAHIGGSITARFESINEECLGIANIREETHFTENERIIIIEADKPENKTVGVANCVTILVRGSTEFVVEEAKRSIWDALCAVRNILTSKSIIYGGGSSELSTAIFLMELSRTCKELSTEEGECLVGFSKALLDIPMVLAKNSGFEAVSYLEKLRHQQISNKEHTIGVDCLETGECNMKTAGVFEALNSKIRQLKMAVELACMVLKINDMINITNE